ncbi:MAG TPA: gamma-glutamyltransferase [Longimicrobiales bacterium]|nr:gamma-glutamyltransferase [Longimicrobiales bacterium]
MRRALLVLAALALTAPSVLAQVTSPATRSGRSTVYAPRAAVGTSQPLATGAALKILEEGGNAFDAAVAAAAVLNVTEPYMTGIGGDMFALVWSVEEGGLVGLDASGRAGSKASAQALRDAGETDVPYQGPQSVTVPGALSGWQALLDRFGTMTLGQVLQPAIRIAEEGYPVTPIIAQDWRNTADLLRRNPAAAATFLMDDEGPQAGQWFRNPDLARTFRRIAEGGSAEFYGGSLGQEIVMGLDRLGGFLTLEDLSAQEVRWVDPLSVDYKGHTLWELPPAGQGVAALEMLKMLEGFDLKSMGHNSAQYLHTLIEAKKLAYADLEEYVADPDYMKVQADRLLAPDFVRARASAIDPAHAADHPQPGALSTESETIYLSVADDHGNMVSFICSIYEYFGSGVVIPGTGFALQNRGAGFNLEAGHPNELAPGKRPFHTIIPAFATKDGAPWLSFGVMGGSMQPQGHVQLLLNLVDFGMDLQEAVDAPRFRHFNGTTVAIENLPEDVATTLRAMGHTLRSPDGVAFGGAQAVMKLGRGWAAASDPRKDGMAAGR